MKLQCNDLLEGERRYSFSCDAERFPILVKIAADGDCEFQAPIEFSLRARQTSEMVEIDGEFATRMGLTCGRCLKPFVMDRSAPVTLTYARQLPESLASDGDGEFQLSPEEAGLLPYEGDEIDLLEGLQEQVVLSIPYRILCNEDCKGLCPRCGADLNSGDCGCGEDAIDPRFEALKHLKLPDQF